MYYDINRTEMENIIEKKLKGTFLYTGIAVFLTFITSFFMITNDSFRGLGYSLFPFVIAIQIIVPIVMGLMVYKAKSTTLLIGLFVYSIATGVTLSAIAVIYTLNSILSVLIGTLVLFIVLASYGYITRSNLMKYSSLLFVGLLSIIIVSIINIFLKSSSVDFMLSILGVAIFVIYVAYDTQRIKQNIIMYANQGDIDILDRVEIVGAFSLYLDFINLFIYLIRLFGKRRD